LFPREGNFKQFNLKKDILSKIEIPEKEREEAELKENAENRRIEWNTEKDAPKAFDFSTEELGYLKQCCEKISGEALPDDMWATVEKIYNAMQA
jgi:hypothetical protein